MKVSSIKIYKVQIPFTTSISHNLKARKCSESVVLAIHAADGKIGYGEGAPRPYVTGESTDKVITIFKKAFYENPILEITQLSGIKDWCNWFIKKYNSPSISTAVEIALLDLLGQFKNHSIADFLSNDQSAPIPYSGLLPYLPMDKFEAWLEKIKTLELPHLKIKVGKEDDLEKLAIARKRLGPNIDIRVDANRAWSFEEAISKISKLSKYNISCVEEPLKESEISKLPELAALSEVAIMLDESIYTMDQARYYANQITPEKLLFNLKISKSGGLLGASALYQFAKSQGIACQLGCNVGESAILSAAGRIFSQTHSLKYLEGSYAAFFMADDITNEPLSFSKKGLAKKIERSGLGISINTKKLELYSSSTEQIIQETPSVK